MIADPDDRVPTEDEVQDLCEELAELASEHHLNIATAESLTAGNLASQLGRATSSGDWYCGGVIAYQKEVKYSLLKVPEGPVVSEEAALAMARSTAELMGANLAVAVTGEAGPEPQEDKEPGTVWFGVFDHGSVDATKRVFEGDPPDVLAATVAASVRILVDRAKSSGE